jgi:tellurite resistance protein TerA
MTELTQGGNAPISGNAVTVILEWAPQMVGGSEVDVSAFMLGANGKVRNDNDFIFYGSTTSGCGSVRLSSQGSSTRFDVELGRVPADIEKIAFTATLTRAPWGQAQSLRLSVAGTASYAMVTAGKTEAAVIVGELYKRNGAWKIRAVGQGFNGGLGPLATSFGVDISDDAGAAPAPPAPAPAPAPVAAPVPAPVPAAPKLNLSKITLEKSGSSAKISLEKGGAREININLNWSQPKGFFASKVDLDLGVFIELRDGTKSLIDGLQFSQGRGGPRNVRTRQGCFTGAPWVWHAGDDRSGGVSEGENVFINPEGIAQIKRMTIYTFIFDGAPNWGATDAVVTVRIPNQEIAVQMGSQSDARTFCAIATLDFSGTGDVTVTKTVTFHRDHEDCDRTYAWGFRYSAGSK